MKGKETWAKQSVHKDDMHYNVDKSMCEMKCEEGKKTHSSVWICSRDSRDKKSLILYYLKIQWMLYQFREWARPPHR